MTTINKTSIKIPAQLPEFIRSDENYQTFVAFLQAYYEWLEQSNIGSGKQGVLFGSQNLLNYNDIDHVDSGDTYNKFIDYYLNDFLPNFPVDALADKNKLIKIARNLYATKGTPASYEFLFRALYNSDVEIFPTREVVFKASDGKWYVSKSLKLDSEDENFLSINNLRIFGETSKSFATVERGLFSGRRIELYISNIERIFQSGETIRVVDNNNQTLYFKDGKVVSQTTPGSTSLTAKIIGSISSVQINSRRRGQLYRPRTTTYSGDPVVFYGGLNSANGIGAEAFVQETTTGSIRAVNVLQGSNGYRVDPNTLITFSGGGGTGAIANVGAIDPSTEINVAFIPTDFIGSPTSARQTTKLNGIYSFFGANVNANLNCSLANAFTFANFSTFALDSVIVNNGGGGYSSIPLVQAESIYDTTHPEPIESLRIKGKLGSLGILGPIEIITPGTGYQNTDFIIFSNTAGGVGANANVTVNATGSIISVNYNEVIDTNSITLYPKGGLGFNQNRLPNLTINTSTGSGGTIRVNQVLGSGAVLEAVPDERGIGAITSILVTNFGEDYISAPFVSLKVRDLIVANLTLSSLPEKGDIIYQGNSLNESVFKANVDSTVIIEPNVDPLQSKFRIRVYNYNSNTKTDLQLKVTDRLDKPNLYIDLDTTYDTLDETGNFLFRNGIRTYGNGAAEATARFLNGLIIGQGQYLNDDGFASSYQILQNEDFNNFSYQLKVQRSFSAYKEILFKLLHPSGTKVIPINTLKSNKTIDVTQITYGTNSLPLSYYTGTAGSNASVFGSFDNPSNNIIKFAGLASANIAEFINVNTIISVSNTNGPNLYSEVISVDHTSNTVVISENVFLRFANVARANIVNGNTALNIFEITNQYDLINNNEYSNTQNKLRDIAFAGDNVKAYLNATSIYTGTITYVEYSNNVIFVNPAPSFNGNNALITVGRDLVGTDVMIYNTVGVPGTPYLTTQDGRVLLTQDGRIITLGI
jgi:hypothetical protein